MDRAGGRSDARLGVLAAIAVLVALLAVPQVALAQKHRKHKHLPDLIITSVVIRVPSTGSTPYVQVQPDGTTTPFNVRVDVENIGSAPAPKTHLKVHFPSHGLRAITTTPALAPGAHTTVVFVMHNVKLGNLFPLQPVAVANWNFHVPEKRYTNNQATGTEVAVIAHRWRVPSKGWTAHLVEAFHGGTIDCDAYNVGQTDFWFYGYDSSNKIFSYWVEGGIAEDCTFKDPQGVCTGKGSGLADPPLSMWPRATSYFKISYDEGRYAATIDPSAEKPFTVTITCPAGSSKYAWPFEKLVTFPIPISVAPAGASKLINHGKDAAGFATIDYTWHFDAVIPGCIACS